jgi:hypothetical protein
MQRDFTIRMGICLVQPPYELDIHNFYEFQDLKYSVVERTCTLQWLRSQREGISPSLPTSVSIVFRGVSEFRFLPRDLNMPFSEDDCVRDLGYWTDEAWAGGNLMICNDQEIRDTQCLNAIEFMSGAIIVVQADSANATIVD